MRKKEAKILIIDDDKDVLFSAKMWLRRFFTEVITLQNPKKMLNELSDINVVLLDMNFRKGYEDGEDGLYWLNEIQTKFPYIPVILMTAYGEVNLAVTALKSGASDFILKPWNKEKLYASVNMAVDLSRKNKKLNQWENLQNQKNKHLLDSKNPTMQSIYSTAEKVATTDANILITGENGTGKYVLAEYIHNLSNRKKEPFVHIDLGSIPENLFETEMFGYVQGAFTDAKKDNPGKIENADGGTVFLDEIGNLSLQLQTKILSLIQNKKISRIGETLERNLDIRFIFATNENIHENIKKNLFRADLYYRINTVELHIPPLRERKEDLESFTNYFKIKYEQKYGKENLSLLEKDLDALKEYSWPGNIRELDHTIERAVIMADYNKISIQLNEKVKNETPETLNIEEMESSLIKKAMHKYKGNISAAAEALGLSRAALYRRLEKFDL